MIKNEYYKNRSILQSFAGTIPSKRRPQTPETAAMVGIFIRYHRIRIILRLPA
jgi:hypothetical protein